MSSFATRTRRAVALGVSLLTLGFVAQVVTASTASAVAAPTAIRQFFPAHEEGGSRDFGVMVTAFSGDHGRVQRLHAVTVEPRFAGGTRHFERVRDEEITIDTDLVLLAIGFSGPLPSPLLDGLGVARDQRGNLAADAHMATSAPGVFAAGDAMRGASLIVWAIADGRIAARSCDRYLMGSSRLP